jgi:hypothetical protein
MVVSASIPVFASPQDTKFSKGSLFLTGQIGLNSLAATDDPFDTWPLPLGASLEFSLSNHIGIGATIMYDKWSDYLRLFAGKFTFTVYKPSLDLIYHLNIGEAQGLDFFTGINLGYSFVSVSNELGNEDISGLKDEPHIAPLFGAHLYFWENAANFLNKIMITAKAGWSVTGDFSGIFGSLGIRIMRSRFSIQREKISAPSKRITNR